MVTEGQEQYKINFFTHVMDVSYNSLVYKSVSCAILPSVSITWLTSSDFPSQKMGLQYKAHESDSNNETQIFPT